MCLLKYSITFLFLIVITSCSSSSLLLERGTNKIDFLETCLSSAGVDTKNLINRDSGKGYDELNWQWNTLDGITHPIAYLVAYNVSDVQSAIKCCRSANIRIVARGGGHGYTKNGYGDSKSLVLDLTNLKDISLDPILMKCTVGAGTRNGRIIPQLSSRKFFVPVGICPTVAIAGLALGGGYGYFTRQYGLTSDKLLELEMVDAEGNLLTINNNTDADLFFALRGGGGGSYGIVTKLTFKMYLEPESIVLGVLNFSFERDFLSFFDAWQNLIINAPNNIGTIVVMTRDNIKMHLFDINSTNSSKGTEEISQILSSFPSPIDSTVDVLSYNDFVLEISKTYVDKTLKDIAELEGITRHNKVGWKKVKSIYVDKLLDWNEIIYLKPLISTCLELKSSTLAFLQNGGAMNDLSRSETAFVHRGNLYDIQLEAFTEEESEYKRKKAESAIKYFYESSKKVLNHRKSYQNYLDKDIPDYLERYYGESEN